MNLKFFLTFFSLVLIFSSVQVVYGDGSGSEESDTLFINQNYFKVKLETSPSILEGNESQIDFDITTINDDTQQIISGVEYKIEIFDSKNNLIVKFDAYSPNEKIETLIVPSQTVNFLGETTENGSWLASDQFPLTVEAPLFLEGGLVNVNITILSINSEPVSGDDTTFQILFIMGEFIPFTIDIDDKTADLVFATYFDRIEEFHYDDKNKMITAKMPFNWDKDFIESIPFVHAEYYIPKTINIFNNHEILLTINDVSYFGTIDRSGDEEIVVHFLLSSSKLLKLYDQIPSDKHDTIIFGIESGKLRDVEKKDASLEDGDKVILLSTEEDWKFHLSLTPKGKINPGNDVTLHLEFHDPVTNSIIQQNVYDLDIFLNGKIVESKKALDALDGTDYVKVTFNELGAVIVRISNVNNFDTSGEFSFKVTEPKEEILSGDHIVDIAIGSSLLGCENDNSCYIPSSLNVQPNQIVLWDNKDSAAHTVTSGTPTEGSSGTFDSRVVAGGKKFSYEFENKGIFDYYCTLHPWMMGAITVSDSKSIVPSWIKNNADWWAEGVIDDDSFIQGIQFLIQEDILIIPSTTQGFATNNEIPSWIKNNADWWAEGVIDDDSFIQGIQFLIKEGILQIQ